jgi:hypothetical protein
VRKQEVAKVEAIEGPHHSDNRFHAPTLSTANGESTNRCANQV